MPKYKKKIALWILATQIIKNILDDVFENHPEIMFQAIAKIMKENYNDAEVQEEDY